MTIGMWGAVVMIGFAVVVGIVSQIFGDKHANLEWLTTSIAALVGGLVANQYLGPFTEYGPRFDGIVVVPALIGAVVVGAIVDGFARTTVSQPV